MKRGNILLGVFLGIFLISFLSAAVPQSLSIQGKLTNSTGSVLSGTYNLTFNIYNVYSGGISSYTSSQNVTTDSNGIYSVILGSVDLNFSEQYYLGITVESDSEMTPRINLTSSPYSFRTENISVSGVEFDSNVNLSSYNITTTGTGFFGWLGSLTSRVTSLFVGEINATGNIQTGGNVTADYFIGNGSLLTDLPSGDNSSWNETYADTKYLAQADESNLNVNSSVYSNSSTWWASVSGWVSGWFVQTGNDLDFNETKLNETIDARTVAAESDPYWTANQSSYYNKTEVDTNISNANTSMKNYVDGTFIAQADESNLNVNSSNSSTWWASVSGWVSGWFVQTGNDLDFNETKLNETIDARTVAAESDPYWTANQSDYMNETELNETFVNLGGDVLNGTFNLSDGILRILDEGSLVVYDTAGEGHLVDADLERLDEVRANTFTTPLNSTTFSNSTGYYLNVSSDDGNRIAVIINNDTGAFSTRFAYSNKILKLNNGTNETPIMNWIYVAYSGNDLDWFVSTSKPSVNHALVAKVLVGSTDMSPYLASLGEEASNSALKSIQHRFKLQNLLYVNGFDYTATESYLSVGSGDYLDGIYELNITLGTNSSAGFFTALNNGTYLRYTSFGDFTQYGDGDLIGSNKYFNVLFGAVPYNGRFNLFAVVQDKPTTEYNSITDAYADNDNTLNILPGVTDLDRNFLQIARVVVNSQSGVAQILPNGDYAEDYRGGVAGGVSSGGAFTEADPLSIHYDGTTPLTANWDAGAYNITASWFKGLFNWTTLTNWLSFNGSVLSFNETKLNDTIDARDTQKNASGYLYNDSTTIYLNDTKLNETIDARSVTSEVDPYWTANQSSYYNKTEVDTNISDANTSMKNYVDGTFIAQADESNLNVNSSNSSTWWASVSGWVSGWFVQTGNDLDFNETKLNETIDARSVTSEVDPYWTANYTAYNDTWSSTYNATYDATVSSQWTTNGSDVYYNTGNVGIGTDNPSKKLEVSNTTQGITFDPTVATPTINTTSQNLSITSAGGSVIITLGA